MVANVPRISRSRFAVWVLEIIAVYVWEGIRHIPGDAMGDGVEECKVAVLS